MQCPVCQHDLTRVGKFWVCPEHGLVTPQDTTAAPAAAAGRHVFISYGRGDALDFVSRLAGDLRRRGHQLWLDLEDIEKGGLWEIRVEQGIRNCSAVLAVL